jgi:hypothetical protein
MLYARTLSYRSVAVAGLLSLLGLLAATPAYAAAPKGSITIAFTATVNLVDDPAGLVSGVHVGDVITGTYTYDPATPDTNDLAGVGDYSQDKKFGVTVNLGQFTTQTDKKNTDFLIEISDNFSGSDNYVWHSYRNTSTGPAIDIINLQLDDFTQTALNSPSLPTVPPVLSAWTQDFGLDVQGAPVGRDRFLIRSNLTQVRKV